MCVVSNIGDQWKQTFPDRWPSYPKPVDCPDSSKIDVTKEEFDALKKEVEELKKLLLAAKEFDEKTGQKIVKWTKK